MHVTAIQSLFLHWWKTATSSVVGSILQCHGKWQTCKRSGWKTCLRGDKGCPRQRTELCINSRTDTSSRSHHSNRVSHQKQQEGRNRGRTAVVEGISCSCWCKSNPFQPHGRPWHHSRERPEQHHLAGRKKIENNFIEYLQNWKRI